MDTCMCTNYKQSLSKCIAYVCSHFHQSMQDNKYKSQDLTITIVYNNSI